MARVDYESAWTDLLELIASRDGWGSKQLTLEMAKIAARHRVSEGVLERALRIYGGQLQGLVADSVISEAPASGPGGTTPSGSVPVPDRSKTTGGREGEYAGAGAAAA